MAGKAPLEVGTRGTIGSLLRREIDYFRRIELDHAESCMGSLDRASEETASGRRYSWPRFRFSIMSWRKRKRRNNGVRPGICSMVEVAERQGSMNEVSGFSYLNLRAESMRFDVE
ncbi:hypothetical protein PHJA_001846100 [Phtheirospermum japonicum]|uniref:Uncharacterized protein n=1 Tax=Phtheirospermum japonicum TaxID=374723 RepID=A0A830CBM4_9LAMI|nr:hypothetical protein PHJA_001846100 [Phtheirospermum japonicum]